MFSANKMKIIFAIFTLIGTGLTAATLEDDFKDFIALIPEKQIREIANKYMATDPEFQAAVVYLQGKEFSALVNEISEKKAVKEFKQYMIDAGIDVEAVLEYINSIIVGAQPTVKIEPRSLKGFLEEVKKTLPIGKFIKMFLDKMKSSPAFKDFYAKVSSEDSHQLVEEVRNLTEVQRLCARLTELGIEVEKYIKIVYVVFGWK